MIIPYLLLIWTMFIFINMIITFFIKKHIHIENIYKKLYLENYNCQTRLMFLEVFFGIFFIIPYSLWLKNKYKKISFIEKNGKAIFNRYMHLNEKYNHKYSNGVPIWNHLDYYFPTHWINHSSYETIIKKI